MSTTITKCKYCKINIKDGIICNSNIYCNEICYKAAFRPTLIPKTICVPKTCNYCLTSFDTSIRDGINYKTLWFCCEDHLILANPRPKIMVGMGYPVAIPYNMLIAYGMAPPMVLHHGHYIGPGVYHYMP
jgi:hypothetical protein